MDLFGWSTPKKKNLTPEIPDNLFRPEHYQDTVELHELFYRNFDASLAYELAHTEDPRTRPNVAVDPLGEGRHFRAFKFMAQTNSMPLCIALPKASFFGLDKPNATRMWSKLISRLTTRPIPMIPPIESIIDTKTKSLLAIVTPFGDDAFDSRIADHWKPLSTSKENTLCLLKRQSLCIDDVIQVKCFKGTPFICDFSDLSGW